MSKQLIKSIVILLIVSINTFVLSSPPLSACGAGTAVFNAQYGKGSLPSPFGTCQLPVPTGYGVAGVNTNFFNNGAICGTCFNITGSKGSTVVMVSNTCDSGSLCTQTDHAHFIISPDDFAKITDASTTTTLNGLGYQQVSCDNSLYISYNVSVDAWSNGNYMGLYLANQNVPIRAISLSGSPTPFSNSNGFWTWNSNGNGVDKINAPVTLTLFPGANGGNSIKIPISSPPSKKFSGTSTAQFTPNPPVGQATCGKGTPSAAIYADGVLAAGWLDGSYKYQTPVSYTPSNIEGSLNPFGGIQLKYDGGFPTSKIVSLSFSAKSPSLTSLHVYMGNGTIFRDVALTSSFTTFNISISSLTTNAYESGIVFQNNVDNTNTITLNNIQWVLAPGAQPTPGNINVIGSGSGSTSSGVSSGASSASSTGAQNTSGQISGASSQGSNDLSGGASGKNAGSSATTLTVSFTLLLSSLIFVLFF